MKAFLIMFLLLISVLTYSQTIKVDTTRPMQQNEQQVIKTLADSTFKYRQNYDTTDHEGILEDNLLMVLRSQQSFRYTFPLLCKKDSDYHTGNISLIYSDDSLFRIFNWLSPYSGSYMNFPAMYQAMSRGGHLSLYFPVQKEGAMQSVSYGNVYRLNALNKQLYLCIGTGQYDGRHPFEAIEEYEVKDDSIRRIDILKDTLSTMENGIIDRQASFYGPKAQSIPYSVFNPITQVLTIPYISGTTDLKNIRWTHALLDYKFNGERFVLIKRYKQHATKKRPH